MKKSLSLIVFLFTSVMIYGQHISFQANKNLNASELLQQLNKLGDSLILENKSGHILIVDIISDSYSKQINVNNSKTEIDLKVLPIGNYVIQAKIDHKWIVMYLEKYKNYDLASPQLIAPTSKTNIQIDNPIYYWVVSESNSNFGSSKSMRLEPKENVARLISKNKLELQSEIAKNNKLIVYTIYNKSKFMTKQLRNPDYYKSAEESNYFDTKPYYKSNSKFDYTLSP